MTKRSMAYNPHRDLVVSASSLEGERLMSAPSLSHQVPAQICVTVMVQDERCEQCSSTCARCACTNPSGWHCNAARYIAPGVHITLYDSNPMAIMSRPATDTRMYVACITSVSNSHLYNTGFAIARSSHFDNLLTDDACYFFCNNNPRNLQQDVSCYQA